MRSAQPQQAMSTAMLKQAAAQQDQMANLLAKQPPQPVAQRDYNFSVYA